MNNSCTVLLIMAALTATSVSARPGDRIDRRPIHVCQQCSDLRFAPDLAADADGRFVVVWTKSFVDEIRARRYAADGTPLGNEFLVASGEIASSPAVAMASDGRFVVTWVEGVLDGSGSQIGTHLLARRFGANGAAIPGVLTVSSPAAPGVQDVAMDSAGNFVITWNDLAREIQAYARSYDATGTPRGPELVVANVGRNPAKSFRAWPWGTRVSSWSSGSRNSGSTVSAPFAVSATTCSATRSAPGSSSPL